MREIALKAINKFVYFALNYNVIAVEYTDFCGSNKTEYVPEFFKVFKEYEYPHLVSKWKETETLGSYGRVMAFYTLLDNAHRVAMLDYIVDNYKDELSIHLSNNE